MASLIAISSHDATLNQYSISDNGQQSGSECQCPDDQNRLVTDQTVVIRVTNSRSSASGRYKHQAKTDQNGLSGVMLTMVALDSLTTNRLVVAQMAHFSENTENTSISSIKILPELCEATLVLPVASVDGKHGVAFEQ